MIEVTLITSLNGIEHYCTLSTASTVSLVLAIPAQDEECVGDVDNRHASPGVAGLQEQRGGDHYAHCLNLEHTYRAALKRYEVKKLHSLACSRQQITISPPHIHKT